MKKLTAVLIVAVMAMATMTGCGQKANDLGTTKAGEMVMGFDASFPPYGYIDDDGEYIGFDIDLAKEVCERLDIKLVLQPIDWNSKDMELEAGTIDCIWNGFTINGREDDYTWSDPYVDNSQVFVVAKDSEIATHADLAGKAVSVQAGSSALSALESEDCADLKASFSELIEVADYNTAFMNLEAGACEAVAMDIGVADFQIESRGGGYVMLEDALSSEMYGIGFLKGNETLRDAVMEELNAMVEDGTFMEIAKEWGQEECVSLGK